MTGVLIVGIARSGLMAPLAGGLTQGAFPATCPRWGVECNKLAGQRSRGHYWPAASIVIRTPPAVMMKGEPLAGGDHALPGGVAGTGEVGAA